MQLALYLVAGLVFTQTPDSVATQGVAQTAPAPAKRKSLALMMKNAVYVQDDHGGNRDLKEDAFIVESILVVTKRVAENHTAMVRGRLVVVSAASYDAAKERGIVVSNATTTVPNPGAEEIGAGWTYHPGPWSFGARGSIALEHAYRSRMVGLDLTRSLLENDTRLALSLRGFYDTVRMIRYDGTHDEDTRRKTITSELGWTQLLTATSLANLTLSYSRQWGFLATSYNSVRIGPADDDFVTEEAPDQRNRKAATVRYRSALFGSSSAYELGYRYYWDDWDIRSHTANVSLSFYLWNRRLLLEPGYRFYVQSKANFFASTFADLPAVGDRRTSDADLGRFTGHMASVTTRLLDASLFGADTDYDLGISYYRRSDGIDMFWLTLGFDTRAQ